MNEPTPTTEPATELEWRQRAIRAEQEGEQLKARVEEIEARLHQQQQQAERQTRRHELERLLTLSGAVDVETAATLAQQRLDSEDAGVAEVVRDLKSAKPFLFGRPLAAPVMAGASDGAPDPLEDAADAARRTGDRNQVLRYLRLRRQAG